LQPFKAMVGIAMPPKADNPRLDPNLLGNRPGAAPGRRQQNDPSPLQIALQCHRRAATCLEHLAIFLRKLDFSCFGYHPDVESRLTLYEKWVLAVNAFAYLLLEILTEPNDVYSTKYNAMFKAMDHHVVYGRLLTKFPKGDITAQQEALQKLADQLTLMGDSINGSKDA